MSNIIDKDFYLSDSFISPRKGRWRQPRIKSTPIVSPAHNEKWHQVMLIKLKAARLHRHLTQKQLAALLGSTQSWVSSFENSRINPSIGFLLKYSALLGKKLTITID